MQTTTMLALLLTTTALAMPVVLANPDVSADVTSSPSGTCVGATVESFFVPASAFQCVPVSIYESGCINGEGIYLHTPLGNKQIVCVIP